MTKKGKKKRKLNKKAIFLIIIIVILTIILIGNFGLKITNVYIIGNEIYTDEEILKKADLTKYPSTFVANSFLIERKLEKDKFIRKASVSKKNFFKEIYIKVEENYPLFIKDNVTYLYDLKTVDELLVAPTITNDLSKYEDKLIEKLREVNRDILTHISEIKYDPNEVDKKRFLITMDDGIYVYLTLSKFDKINNYSDIVSTLEGKKGVLYLDSGGYLEVFK